MNFHEIAFPLAIAFHSTGGPVRKTEIVTLGSGYEERRATRIDGLLSTMDRTKFIIPTITTRVFAW